MRQPSGPLHRHDSSSDAKHYPLFVAAGAPPAALMAINPRRNYLYVQNVGLNAGVFWFEQSKNYGQAIPLGPLQAWSPQIRCPVERCFFQSLLGTTFAIIEGYEPMGAD